MTQVSLLARFEQLQRELHAEPYAGRLDKPLSFWALAADRRLPLPFMGSTIRELLVTPYEELLETPGVGLQKINSLLKLLARVAKQDPTVENLSTDAEPVPQSCDAGGPWSGEQFSPDAVSEVLWARWRENILRHGLQRETLGRFAPSLERLPRVVWLTPLAMYTDVSLTELRQLKTHGERRVGAVLEVFAELNRVLDRLGPLETMCVRIVPRFVSVLEAWIDRVLARPGVPTASEIEQCFVRRLIEQLRIDAGVQMAELVEHRLGLQGEHATVRDVAERWGLTRARIYQLLADVGCRLSVRWPEGYEWVSRLTLKLHAGPRSDLAWKQFDTAVELFFPGRSIRATAGGKLLSTDLLPEQMIGG